ncbi:T-cell-interacting, activating receptor on myeloid cells protein 1 [Hemicordylus capensis]|uniref:T-cell-interacting, activating receptor on myeloid cells protein 1 n=1 Tax=Hemicordylus capensis TaxID=884348 RepID=UPI00230356CB|nr:T-cell-interacting, activating receptor on myeloid cells protein 1 [Hemicordylus capensis]
MGFLFLPSLDHYPKPSIAVNPGTQVLAGQGWTIRCWASFPGVSFVLYQDREFRMEVTPRGDSNVAEFSLKNVTVSDAGKYTCYYHSTADPVIWSNASNPVQLKVIDVANVSIYQEVLVDAAGRYRVNCSGPSTSEGWFYLFWDGKLLAETRAWQDGHTISFNLTEEALSITKGELSCRYGENWLNDTEGWTQDSHSRSPDFATANLLRLVLAGCILSLGLLFVADACWNRRRQED